MVCNASGQPLAQAMSAILRLPTIHPLWVVYAELVLRMDDVVKSRFNAADVATITAYGLTMFPRSYELLLLRATLYLQEGNTNCAGQLYRAAAGAKHLSTNYFNATQYFDRLNASTSTSTTSVISGKQCLSILHGHYSTDYQSLHTTITNLIGDSWTNVSTHSIMPIHRKPPPIMTTSVTAAMTIHSDGTSTTAYLPSLQVGCSTPINCARPGFVIADALEKISTHYVTMAYDLHMIESGSVGVVYSSHTLEHLSYNVPPATCATFPVSNRAGSDKGCYSELDATLAEWRRVLATGGTLLVSVPDMTILAKNFIDPALDVNTRLFVRALMFGGQNSQYDFHKNAFYFEYLQELLVSHGFCNVRQVKEFGLFMDFSGMKFESEEAFSLNVKATAC